ncbi:hypothetical protein [Clostridium sp.]|uniref:hypothetical protein n=1 Tax=Clostridium sp. TaxID=1506 RepID=UPI002FC999B1
MLVRPIGMFRFLRKFTLMIICITMIFLITACTNKGEKIVDKTKDEPKETQKSYVNAVFERNNNIYFYDEKMGSLYPIGDTTKFKELTMLSPDKKRVAFKYFYEEELDQTEIFIYNLESKEYNKIAVDDELENIISLTWINNERLLVSAAINPSVLKYGIYDINSNKQVNSIKGLLMEVFEDGNILLYSKTSRSDEKENSTLYLGDKLIYQLDNSIEEIHFATISSDKRNIAFSTFSYDADKGEVVEFLYNGKFDFATSTISDISKITIPSNISGAIFYDKSNDLFIKGEESNYRVEGSFFTLIDTAQEVESIPTEEQLIKFKQVLKKTFVDEFIEDYLQLDELEIYNIQWF